MGDLLFSLGEIQLFSSADLAHALAVNDGSYRLKILREGMDIVIEVPKGPLGLEVVQMNLYPDSRDMKLKDARIQKEIEDRNRQILSNMIVSTTHGIQGATIRKYCGVVTAECAYGLNIFKDIFSTVTDVLGGRSSSTQSALREARERCINELKIEALQRGANCIVGVSLNYSEFSGGSRAMLFLVASGTAVSIETIK